MRKIKTKKAKTKICKFQFKKKKNWRESCQLQKVPTHHHPHILIFSLSLSLSLHMQMICRTSSAMAAFPCSRVSLYFSLHVLCFTLPFISMPFSFICVKRLQLACKFIYFLLFSLLGFWWTLDLWSFCDPYCGLVWGFSFLLRNFCTHLKIYNLEWSSSKPFDFFFFLNVILV